MIELFHMPEEHKVFTKSCVFAHIHAKCPLVLLLFWLLTCRLLCSCSLEGRNELDPNHRILNRKTSLATNLRRPRSSVKPTPSPVRHPKTINVTVNWRKRRRNAVPVLRMKTTTTMKMWNWKTANAANVTNPLPKMRINRRRKRRKNKKLLLPAPR